MSAARRYELKSNDADGRILTLISCDVEWDREKRCWVATNAEGYCGEGERMHEAALACFLAHLVPKTEAPVPGILGNVCMDCGYDAGPYSCGSCGAT